PHLSLVSTTPSLRCRSLSSTVRCPPRSPLFPYTTLFRSLDRFARLWVELALRSDVAPGGRLDPAWRARFLRHADRFLVGTDTWVDRKSTRLNSSHEWISYAVFCLKKKNTHRHPSAACRHP